ncbi:MAG TPA: pantetheine-phosphate adenylyltransferase [Firmicutes bacterium]|nr:pantetheine-phosphate adenylyltransferase [Bacillota bacterium]
MKGIYPGTFDPITNGHMDIIERADKICDSLVVAVGDNTQKVCTFDVETRVAMIKESIADRPNIEVISFGGLLVDAAHEVNADVIIRGLRAISDYEMEVQMAIMNRTLDHDLDTVILVASHHWSFISSSIIKEIHRFGGDISPFVPAPVLDRFNGMNRK